MKSYDPEKITESGIFIPMSQLESESLSIQKMTVMRRLQSMGLNPEFITCSEDPQAEMLETGLIRAPKQEEDPIELLVNRPYQLKEAGITLGKSSPQDFDTFLENVLTKDGRTTTVIKCIKTRCIYAMIRSHDASVSQANGSRYAYDAKPLFYKYNEQLGRVGRDIFPPSEVHDGIEIDIDNLHQTISDSEYKSYYFKNMPRQLIIQYINSKLINTLSEEQLETFKPIDYSDDTDNT